MRERGFFALTVRRPIALLVIFSALIVVGVIAYRDTPLQLMPSGFQEPELHVWIPNPDSSAQENEREVARIVEEQLRTLSGLENVYSESEEGSVYIRISFDPGLDLDLAKAEVRDRVERARPLLPRTVQQIAMWSESSSSMPIAYFGLLHPDRGERTDFLIDTIVKPRLEAVHGISRVSIFGQGTETVRILLDEDKVAAAQIDIGDLIARLSSDNFALPLGDMDDGGRWLLLRSDMRFESLDEIADYPVGRGLRVRDLGEVRRVTTVRDEVSRIDGSYASFGIASPESTANVVDTSRAFRAAIAEIEADPAVRGEISFVPYFVAGDLIENSLAQLRETAIWGGVLAAAVLLVFLRRLRLTLCVALSIPASVLMAITFEYFSGGSFNILTMAGVTLALGMLVDNAVVVVENIARRRAEGLDAQTASIRGARDIALAITLATLTTVVVFLPLIFMTEHPAVRVIFGGIGIPLCTALLSSLALAVVFLPSVAARVLGPPAPTADGGADEPAPRGVFAIPARLAGGVVACTRFAWFALLSLVHRANRATLAVVGGPLRFVLVAAILALAAWSWLDSRDALALGGRLASPGVPAAEAAAQASRAFAVSIGVAAAVAIALLLLGAPRWRRRPGRAPARPARWTPRATSVLGMIVASNSALVGWTLRHRLGAAGLSLVALSTVAIPWTALDLSSTQLGGREPGVRFRVAFDGHFTLPEASSEMAIYEDFVEERRSEWGFSHYNSRFDTSGGRLTLYWDDPKPTEYFLAVEKELQESLPRLPGHQLRFYDEEAAGTSSREVVTFSLHGPDSVELERIGAEAVRLLEGIDGLSGVSSPLENAADQLEVQIDRDLMLSRGVQAESALNTITWALRGWMLPRYHDRGAELPFLIELDAEEIAGVETLRDLSVFSAGGQVPLSSFAAISTGKASQSIWRENGQTTFRILGRVEDVTRRREVEDAGYGALAQLDLPRGFAVGMENSARWRQEQEFGELGRAFLLGIVLVFLLMGILFESVLLPFSVLVTVPFAVLGALWTLAITRFPLDAMGWIGLIILAGVVVNNGIVLIDRVHRLARSGLPRDEAVLRGCAERIRPILMTALTTVFGLLPMALAQPADDSIPYRALAAVVAGGLIASTFFTVWVVPLAYTVFDDLSHALSARLRWALRRPGHPAVRPSTT